MSPKLHTQSTYPYCAKQTIEAAKKKSHRQCHPEACAEAKESVEYDSETQNL